MDAKTELKDLLEKSEYPALKEKLDIVKKREREQMLKIIQKVVIEFDISVEELCKLNRKIRKSKTEYLNKKTGEVWKGLGRRPKDLTDNPQDWEEV